MFLTYICGLNDLLCIHAEVQTAINELIKMPGGFIHKQWTAIPVVGNHEFKKTSFSSPRKLSIQWRPQFNLPVEKNLDQSLHETVYSVNYQDILILVLNSNEFLEKQTEYIKETLRNSDAKWKIVTCHHSIFSPAQVKQIQSITDMSCQIGGSKTPIKATYFWSSSFTNNKKKQRKRSRSRKSIM